MVANPGSRGYFGSDVWLELTPRARNQLEFDPIVEAAVTFVLACRAEEAGKYANPKEWSKGINVVTSYPQQAIGSLAIREIKINNILCVGGSVEGSLVDYPGADMIYEMVETGNSIRDNNLSIVLPDLGRLVIGESWRKDS